MFIWRLAGNPVVSKTGVIPRKNLVNMYRLMGSPRLLNPKPFGIEVKSESRLHGMGEISV